MRSVSVEVDTSGNPISEVYEFIAQDIIETDEFRDRNKYLYPESIIDMDVKYSYDRVLNNSNKFLGSLFASLGWSFLSWGFSLYIDTFGSLSIYGDFVGVIFALLWLYWCMYIVLIGGAINRFYSKYMDNLKNLLIHKNK